MRGVVVELVVRRELVVPLQRAGVGIQRDDRIGIQVGALPRIRIPVRAGIAGAEVQEIQLGVVRAGHPDRSSAVLPGVAVRWPCEVARFTRSRHGVEPPDLFSALRVERGDETADPVLAAGRADDDLVVDDERRNGQRVAELRFRQRDVPDRLADLRVDRDEMPVDRTHEQRIAEDRQTAIDAPTAHSRERRQARRVHPEHAPRRGVERDDVVRRKHGVHDAVDDEGGRLEFLCRLGGTACLEDPLQLEVPDVPWGDLGEQTVAVAGKIPRVGQPVLRLAIRAQDAIEGHLLRARHAPCDERDRDGGANSHGRSPFSETRYATRSPSSAGVSVSR